jgi:uncharacterized membrane protein YfcA
VLDAPPSAKRLPLTPPDLKTSLLGLLALVAAGFAVFWIRRLRGASPGGEPGTELGRPGVPSLLIGVLTDFFDTLGIGSFAPTTALFRVLHLVPDRLIPGTLNVGHALPSVTQALVFIAIIEVEARTLALMIASSVGGAWLGAGVVARWSRRRVQVGMGCALLVAAVLMLRQLLRGAPAGANAVGLDGPWLLLGVAGNLVLGALMTIGIGLYGPCMILVSLLGMNATTAFPIMMGSCAFLMPVAGVRFIRGDAYAPRAALGLTLGGVPAVLVAAFVVRSLPLGAVRGLVVVVAVYTALAMLRAAAIDARAARETRSATADVERETT